MFSKKSSISFFQGNKAIGGEDALKSIKQKISELSNIKNVVFLLGAGASSYAIPNMKDMEKEISNDIHQGSDEEIKALYNSLVNESMEGKLAILYSKKHYLEGISEADEKVKQCTADLISKIENAIYLKINIDLSSDKAQKNVDLYKQLYQKTALRNKDLSRANVFTTNNDLLNEKALDTLNINYNNGFGGGLERVFNPARFHYTFSKKVDANLEKFEPLENMVYLYKLHGSISWIQQEGNELFNIHEVAVSGGKPKDDKSHVLIYPTPLKQSQSLGTPYADLIREFQTKLSQPNTVIFIIGYSFNDEHINNIIYQSLASNSSISVVIFGEYSDCPLAKIKDSRIYRIYGKDDEEKNIHYFEYIVGNILPNVDEDIDTTLLDAFVSSINTLKSSKVP